jgi:hypothetical protein
MGEQDGTSWLFDALTFVRDERECAAVDWDPFSAPLACLLGCSGSCPFVAIYREAR